MDESARFRGCLLGLACGAAAGNGYRPKSPTSWSVGQSHLTSFPPPRKTLTRTEVPEVPPAFGDPHE
jgi:hypothetical protein